MITGLVAVAMATCWGSPLARCLTASRRYRLSSHPASSSLAGPAGSCLTNRKSDPNRAKDVRCWPEIAMQLPPPLAFPAPRNNYYASFSLAFTDCTNSGLLLGERTDSCLQLTLPACSLCLKFDIGFCDVHSIIQNNNVKTREKKARGEEKIALPQTVISQRNRDNINRFRGTM